MTKEEYELDKARRANLSQQTMEVTASSQPTPTQEENDLLRLGLMHPDEKAAPSGPEMPPLAVQQAYLAASGPRLEPAPPVVKPPEETKPPEQPPLGESRRAPPPERSVPRNEPPKP